MKKVTIILKNGQHHETDRGQLNFHAWGVDAVVKNRGELSSRLHIPFTSIDYIEEVIS